MHASTRLTAVAAAVALLTSAPASAQVFRNGASLGSSGTLLTPVRFGGGHRFHGGGYGHHGFGHRGYGFRHGGYGYRRGFGYHRGFGYRGYGYRRGIGAGVAGLAAGALIGSTLAAPAYGYPAYGAPVVGAPDPAAYCSQRFKSYDPATGTYTGYDGLKHPCP